MALHTIWNGQQLLLSYLLKTSFGIEPNRPAGGYAGQVGADIKIVVLHDTDINIGMRGGSEKCAAGWS